MHRTILGAIGLALLAIVLSGQTCTPMVDPANVQDASTTPAERVSRTRSIGQTFIPTHDGLTAIDLLIARYPDQPAADLRVVLRRAADSSIVATRVIPRTTPHNERVRFAFAPLHDSAGQPYLIEITSESTEPNALTVWATDESVYPAGDRLVDGQPVPGALSFRVFYRYDVRAFLRDLGALRTETVGTAIVVLALLTLPGLAAQRLLTPHLARDPAEHLGFAVSASVALIALLYWLATLLGVGLNGLVVGVVLGVAGLVAWPHAHTPFPSSMVRGKGRWQPSPVAPLPTLGAGDTPTLSLAQRERKGLLGRLPSSAGSEYVAVSPSGRGRRAPVSRAREQASAAYPGALPLGERATERPSTSLPTAPLRGSPLRVVNGPAKRSLPVLVVLLLGGWTLGLRLVAIRDLAWPLWVDSVHHTLIARLIAEAGRIPESYGPLVPPQPFTYHFGFHAVVAAAHELTGSDLPWLVLVVGQLLSGLIVFPVYLLASRWTGSRWGGVAAAACVGCLSTMPAYYVSWGRYPQLAGLVVLPAAYLALRTATGGPLPGTDLSPTLAGKRNWLAVLDRHGSAGRFSHIARSGRAIALAALLAAGLVLTHPRVALLFAGLVLASLVTDLVTQIVATHLAGTVGEGAHVPRRWIAPWLRTALVALLAMVMIAPWLARLAGSRFGGVIVSADPVPPTPFALPVYGGFDGLLLALGALGVLVGGRASLPGPSPSVGRGERGPADRGANRTMRRAYARLSLWGRARMRVGLAPSPQVSSGDLEVPLGTSTIRGGAVPFQGHHFAGAVTLVLWVAFAWVLANPHAFGLPVFLFLSNHAVEIALFLPVALGVGLLVAEVGRALDRVEWRTLRHGLAAIGLVGVLMASGQQLGVVNPGTIRYTRGDVAALAWIAAHLPAESRVLINAAPWQGEVYVGADGGYWIPAIAGRATTTPPVLYDGGSPSDVGRVRDVSAAVATWDGDPRQLAELIRDHGVTHVYVGTGSGTLRPSFFLEHGYPVRYTNGQAWVFGVGSGEPSQWSKTPTTHVSP